MKKLTYCAIAILISQPALSANYTGCSDSSYIKYVEKRLSFYAKLDKESYQKAQKELKKTPFEDLSETELELYLYSNTILSARFDTSDVARRNIMAYEDRPSPLFSFMETGDPKHNINIAKGWLALNSGDEREAIRYLIISTKTKSSPVLSSFGPDKTLIRELYKRGHKEAVLEYLDMVQSFWNTASAKEFIKVWRKMIKNNCSIQFQFFDIESAAKLGL